MLSSLTKQPRNAYEDTKNTDGQTGVNSQCNESKGSAGSHGVGIGEAEVHLLLEPTNDWENQTEKEKKECMGDRMMKEGDGRGNREIQQKQGEKKKGIVKFAWGRVLNSWFILRESHYSGIALQDRDQIYWYI